MLFKHLFIFPNHRFIDHFYWTLEERVRYPTGSTRGFRSLRMMSPEGEHEITLTTVDNIRNDRMRGRYFDKVSIHEAVELDWMIHEFIQMNTYRRMAGMKILVDPAAPPKSLFFINDIKVPKHHGVIRDLTV